jgi:hypothetical protein
VQYIVSQCTECQEEWPLDKKSPKKFSSIPLCVPHELQNLTQIEEILIPHALPIMRVILNMVVNDVIQGIVLTCRKMSKNLQCLCQDILNT